MSPQKSTSATISRQGNCSEFKYFRTISVHNRNHNNKNASLSQSRAPEQYKRQSYGTGQSSPQLEMKGHAHLKHENIPVTSQLVNHELKIAEPYIPPTILNYFHSQGHTENGTLRQESQGTSGQDTTVNASSRQDTPSTLNKYSPLTEERPSYSQFTWGLSPSIFKSFLFPQQVTYQKHTNPHTSSHSLKYSNVRRADFDKQIHSSASSYDKPDYTYASTRSSSSSSSSQDENEELDTSFGSISSYDENEYPDTFGRSSASSCDEEEPIFSPTVRYHVDSNILFGDLTPTPPPPPPLPPRERKMKKVLRRPPRPSSVGARQQKAPAPSFVGERQLLDSSSSDGSRKQYVSIRSSSKSRKQSNLTPVRRKEKQRSVFSAKQRARNFKIEQLADTPRRAQPESAYLSDLNSPYRNHSPRGTPSPPSSHGGACCGVKFRRLKSSPSFTEEAPTSGNAKIAPRFNLSTNFTNEQPTANIVKTVTRRDFEQFINEKNLAAIMFYLGPKTTKDSLKVWEREAQEKILEGDRNYGFVDCATETALCARENITKLPFYKMYFGGQAIAAGKHFKLLSPNQKPRRR